MWSREQGLRRSQLRGGFRRDDLAAIEIQFCGHRIGRGSDENQRIAATAALVVGEFSIAQRETRLVFYGDTFAKRNRELIFAGGNSRDGRAELVFRIPFSGEGPLGGDLLGLRRTGSRREIVF